jgi:integrase
MIKMTTAQERFDAIKAARLIIQTRIDSDNKHIEEVRKGKRYSLPSEKTMVDYRKETKAIFNADHPWVRAADTQKMKTWKKRRSAVLCVSLLEAKELLKHQNDLQMAGHYKVGSERFQEWCDTIDKMAFYANILDTVPKVCPVVDPVKKESKRAIGSKMPANWRELLSKRMITWKPQFLVQAVTGCRPGEINRGIEVSSVTRKSGRAYLTAKIFGKKLSEFAGQKERVLSYEIADDSSSVIKELAQLVIDAGGKTVIDYSLHNNPIPEKAFSNAVRSAAEKEFPWLKKSITCYSMRHAVASDMKASDLSSLEISAALGHQVEATKSLYGTALQGKGKVSMAPGNVKATTPVRALKKPKRDFKKGSSKPGGQ